MTSASSGPSEPTPQPADPACIPLESGFALWPDFVLRSTGFPFAALHEAVVAEPAAPGFDWSAAMADGMQRAVQVAGGDPVRMALQWQNPQVLELLVDWLAATADSAHHRNQRRRSSEHTVVKYLQRYHARNESVGFFGPVVWGTIGRHGGRIDVRTAPQLTGRRRVYVEDWAVEAVARAFSADPAIATHLPPALAFGVARLGRVLTSRDGRLTRLTATQAPVVGLVDGRRDVAAIAAQLGLPAAEVEAVLAPLISERLLTRELEVPPDLDAERTVARQLHALPPGPAIARCLAVLDEVETARAAAERAETPATLAAALTRMDDVFARASCMAATRRRDESPTGRRPLVMQAERCVRVELGERLVAELAGPLNLVLTSARWFARRAGEEFEAIAAKVHAELEPMYAGAVPLNALVSRLAPVSQAGDWLDGLVAELTRRWADVLAPEPGAAPVEHTAAALDDAVRREFAGPAPGYAAGRHHSPDVMIAAAGPEAIEAGDYEFVLGELHVGMVTVDSRSFTDFAPDPERTARLAAAGLADGQPRFVPLHVRGVHASVSGWDHPAPIAYVPAYRYLSFGARIGERDVPGKVRADAVSVAEHNGRLWARFPDGTRYPALQVLGEYVAWALVSRFRMLPPAPYSPRVTIDRVVVARESWRIPAADLEPLTRLAEPDAYRELRRVADGHNLPRHMFWRPAPEAKPIYLDLDSPLLAAVALREIRRAVRNAETITFSEMHPGPDGLWLPDGDGRRYPSELRLTVADTTAADPR